MTFTISVGIFFTLYNLKRFHFFNLLKASVDVKSKELSAELKSLENSTLTDRKQGRSKFSMCAKCYQFTRTSELFKNIFQSEREPEIQQQIIHENRNVSTNAIPYLNSGCKRSEDILNDSNMPKKTSIVKSNVKDFKTQNKIYRWVGFTSCFLGMLYLFFRNNAMQ